MVITVFRSFACFCGRRAAVLPVIVICIGAWAPFLQCAAHPDRVIQFTPASISDIAVKTLAADWALEGGTREARQNASAHLTQGQHRPLSLGSELCRQCPFQAEPTCAPNPPRRSQCNMSRRNQRPKWDETPHKWDGRRGGGD